MGISLIVVGELGLEPRLMESKSTFLPLEDPPKYWYSVTGSNRRHPGCKPDTLPTELTEQNGGATGSQTLIHCVQGSSNTRYTIAPKMAGTGGIEPPTG